MKTRIGIALLYLGIGVVWAGHTVGHALNAAFGIDENAV